jgi:hypothetical protein
VVEGARLESDFGDADRATLKHFVAQFIDLLLQDFPRCDAVKRRCSSAVLSLPYTVLTHFPLSLALRQVAHDLSMAAFS